ncbi:MAG: hypothetical protein AAB462_00950 [Patescibacteria group bacterium]
MAVAAAEQINYSSGTEQPHLAEAVQRPAAILVSELTGYEFIQRRADRFVSQAIGSVALSAEVEKSHENRPITSLHDAIHRAPTESEARKVVYANAASDVIERTLKTGHVRSTIMEVDEDGVIQQHGQSLESVQANSLLYTTDEWKMRERTVAEANNAIRMQWLHSQGLLEEYSFVTISCAADNMSVQEMKDNGFFTDTMSLSIQATGSRETTVTTESAFASGVKSPNAPRHDLQAVVALAKKYNIDLTGKSAAEIIDTPFLVRNDLIPNGVVDLVRDFDDCVDSTGNTFFGEDRPRQDYIEYLRSCSQREKTFQSKVELITQDLINQRHTINTPMDAIERLNELSEEYMVLKAVEDTSINPQVFGPVSAGHIEQARAHAALGNKELSRAATKKAIETADSDSCSAVYKKNAAKEPDEGIEGSSKEEWHSGKIFRNTKCKSCDKTKKEVGACHICEDCVNNPTKREKKYNQYKADQKAKQANSNIFLLGLNNNKPPKKLADVISLAEKRRAKIANERKAAKLAMQAA